MNFLENWQKSLVIACVYQQPKLPKSSMDEMDKILFFCISLREMCSTYVERQFTRYVFKQWLDLLNAPKHEDCELRQCVADKTCFCVNQYNEHACLANAPDVPKNVLRLHVHAVLLAPMRVNWR